MSDTSSTLARLCDDQSCHQSTSSASLKGHLGCLKWVYATRQEWHPETTFSAAYEGHVDCMKYAHENGCPWDPYTTYFAADKGHPECLRYAHENGCPWNPSVTYIAAKNGHLECLKYIYKNCKLVDWNDETLKFVEPEIRQFIGRAKNREKSVKTQMYITK